MDVFKAAAKFRISVRRVEALCAEGRIPGAKKVKGRWQIPPSAIKPVDERSVIVVPDDQMSLFDVITRDKKTTLTRREACRALSVSETTLKNWLRLGKIKASPGGSFDRKYVESLARLMKKDGDGKLKSRRNKKKKSGRSLYRDYVSASVNKEAVGALCDSAASLTGDSLRATLAGCAVALFLSRRGEDVGDDFVTPDELFDTAGFASAVGDLLGGELTEKKRSAYGAGLRSGVEYVSGEDTLGFVYISLSDISKRKKTGQYFTPASVVGSMLDLVFEKGVDGDVIDPCCGTGNFLMALALRGVGCRSLHGIDADDVSVMIARINLMLIDPTLTYGEAKDRIVRGDSLRGRAGGGYSLVVGNPPWGYSFSDAELDYLSKKYSSAKKSGAESFDVFVERGIDLLRDGGRLAFVVPEAILNVSSHEAVRRVISERASFSFVSFIGNVFPEVQCPAVLLCLSKNPGGATARCTVVKDGKRFTLGDGSPAFSEGFSFGVDDKKRAVVEKMENAPGVRYLKGNARFALGIVTGNNKEFLTTAPSEGTEPILKGTDVFLFRTRAPENYIKFDPDRFQQTAPEEVYRTRGKIVYRFISSVPVFAYDESGMLSLNSCNVLIPQIRGLGVKYVLAVLNSRAAAFYFENKFASVKMLRSHIEALPIPRADEETRDRVAGLVDAILAGGDPVPLTEQIDSIVLDLYRLTDGEKETVLSHPRGKTPFLPR
ncbi:MAG: N-6 DNA methylase [Clostridia bacterium]|nr:N-6 DNA methylase [Clostridia bacterium]